MEAGKRRQIVVISLVLAAHLVVDLFLLVGPWQVEDAPRDLFLLAWPMAQCSLIALWTGLSRLRSYVRFPLALLGVVSTWFVTVIVLENVPQGEASAGWALMLGAQAAGIAIVAISGCFVWRMIVYRRGGRASSDSPAAQYGLGSLLLWVTILALTLGLGKAAFAALGWTPDVLTAEYFLFFPFIAAYNTAHGLLILLSLLGRKWLFPRGLVAWILIGLLGWSQLYVLGFLFGDDGGTTVADWLVIAGSQALYLYATLVPLRLAGWFGVTQSRTEPTAATAREAGNPLATSAMPT